MLDTCRTHRIQCGKAAGAVSLGSGGVQKQQSFEYHSIIVTIRDSKDFSGPLSFLYTTIIRSAVRWFPCCLEDSGDCWL